MIWNHVGVIEQRLAADGAQSALFANLLVQHLPHLRWRESVAIAVWMICMFVFDPPNANSNLLPFGSLRWPAYQVPPTLATPPMARYRARLIRS